MICASTEIGLEDRFSLKDKKEILDLVNFCAAQRLRPVISTNATLIDKEMAKRISDSGLHRLSISLESLDENIHDFITGTAGAHKRLMQAIRHLKQCWLS